jgi:hypothetical protein
LHETHCDEFLYEHLRQGVVSREMQGALGHCVALKLFGKLREDRAAERQVAQVILERGKAGDGLRARWVSDLRPLAGEERSDEEHVDRRASLPVATRWDRSATTKEVLMRKLIYSMGVSLDGFIAGPDGARISATDDRLGRNGGAVHSSHRATALRGIRTLIQR